MPSYLVLIFCAKIYWDKGVIIVFVKKTAKMSKLWANLVGPGGTVLFILYKNLLLNSAKTSLGGAVEPNLDKSIGTFNINRRQVYFFGVMSA